jgi:hypothetical protein
MPYLGFDRSSIWPGPCHHSTLLAMWLSQWELPQRIGQAPVGGGTTRGPGLRKSVATSQQVAWCFRTPRPHNLDQSNELERPYRSSESCAPEEPPASDRVREFRAACLDSS